MLVLGWFFGFVLVVGLGFGFDLGFDFVLAPGLGASSIDVYNAGVIEANDITIAILSYQRFLLR